MNRIFGRRPLLASIVIILAAAILLPLSFVILRRLGYPFGIRIAAMAEDYNWLLILGAKSATTKAQAFWAMNDRNPLSPWWYIAFDRLYTGLPNGPYLTRLLMQPLLGLSAFAMVHAVTAGRAAGLALAVGLLTALSLYGSSVDQINWNFLGALSLSMLCVACFAQWINGGRRQAAWYGASLVLWYCAFASYSFQTGAVISIALLALMRPPPATGRVRSLLAAALEVLPYFALLVLFVLAWRTTQNPAMAGYYSLSPALLLKNLPESLRFGFWPERYLPFYLFGKASLAWLLPVLCIVFGIVAGLLHASLRAEAAASARDAGLVLLVSFGLVIPTALIESMSATWSIGLRWPMVDQAWQPLLWLSLAALLIALVPASIRIRQYLLSAVVCVSTMIVVAVALGYNTIQTTRSATESALRNGLTAAAASLPPGNTFNFLVLVKPGVALSVPDVMSGRIAQVYFPNRDIGLRVLAAGSQQLEPGHEAWWTVRFTQGNVQNVRIGGGNADYDTVRMFRFDGQTVTPLTLLNAADLAGYPATWDRTDPLTVQPTSAP